MVVGYRIRLFIWYFFLALFFIIIWIQLFKLQIIKSGGLVQEAQKQFYKRQLVLRGDIRDRYSNLLVLDVINYDLYNNVRNLHKIPKEKINKLAELLRISTSDFIIKLSQKIDTKIFSGVDEDLASRIKRLNPEFVYLVPKVTRKYPHKRLASHIVGFVNSDHVGQHGVEYFYEGLLTKISPTVTQFNLFPKGADLILTIDSVLQEYAESELNKAIKLSKAQNGTIIILSPKTGEIYTWAVYPDYDPNLFYKQKFIKNWTITDVYQPGSTFKIITVASALENMTITKESVFYDPGFIKVSNRTIRNHHKSKPQNINLLELFKQSSNVAAAQVALTMKPEDFYNSIKRFMIAKKTNIDLLGESEGLLLDYRKWKKLDLATTAFGQGAVSVTALQLASAVASISNHGIWVQPHVLKGIWDSNYKIITGSPQEVIQERAISQEVADYVSGLLKQSVKENLKAMTYIAGDVPGYEVTGKTGTAQKIREGGKGYLSGHTVASFIGYFPADDPEILALVVIDDPKTGGGWGNTVCGPVFNNVARLAAKRIIEST